MTAREASLPTPATALCPLLSATNQTTNIVFKQLPRHTLDRATALLAQSIKRLQQGRPPSLLLLLLSALCSLQTTRQLTLHSSQADTTKHTRSSHHPASPEHQEMTAREASLPAPAAALCPLLSETYQTTNIAFKQLPRHTLAHTTALLDQSIKR